MKKVLLGFWILFCATVFANPPLQPIEPLEITILQKNNNHLLSSTSNNIKIIYLMQYQLTNKAFNILLDRLSTNNIPLKSFGISNSPSSVKLDMANVPVLDQGAHGSCVTFAVTAAIDAALNYADYLSQLCPLQLGVTLEKNGFSYSGWDGLNASTVLSRFDDFGFVTKQFQKQYGCAGLIEYPTNNPDTPKTGMSLEEYHKIAQDIRKKPVAWTPIIDYYGVYLDKTDMNTVLANIKNILNDGDRVVFGMLLPGVEKGLAGAVGKFKNKNDSWILTPDIAEDMHNSGMFAAHEMVITGYDDNAVAIDDRDDKHVLKYKGLFTVRNSWGDKVGDNGNFYISYDYLKTLLLEAYRIRKLPN